jgi:protein-tyrosine phosphatase
MTAHVRSVQVRSDADELVVTWELDTPATVDVAEGPTPDRIDHAHAITVGPDRTSVRLPLPERRRRYVSVAPSGGGTAVVAAERHVAFEGIVNFRDLGGYPVPDGGRTRWGRVFRSAALHQVTDADLVVFEELGIQVVYDLRSTREREQRRDLPGARVVDLPVFRRGPTRPDPTKAEDAAEFLREVYTMSLEHSADVFGDLFTNLAEPGALPTVFHCTVGKDRTGLVAALLLDLLGVDDDDILDDYELTNEHQSPERWQKEISELTERSGGNPLVAAGLFRAHRGAMAAALDWVRGEGGTIAYLVERGGMADATVRRLHELLIEPPPL